MSKKIKVPANKTKEVSEKLKKYETLNAASKNVLGGMGIGAFGRLAGIAAEKAKQS